MSKETESYEQVATTGAVVDWLKIWGVLEFKADTDDPKEAKAVEAEKNRIRWYVRGYLEEYNDGVEAREAKKTGEDHKEYKFERFARFDFIPEGRSRFSVKADLLPPAGSEEHPDGGSARRDGRGGGPPIGGAHLVPPPPPKPGIG